MFYVPRNAVYRRIDRRKFLELGGGVATTLGAGSRAARDKPIRWQLLDKVRLASIWQCRTQCAEPGAGHETKSQREPAAWV